MENFVAFSASDKAVIVASFSCGQDAEVWKYQGQVDANDARWLTYKAGFPEGTFSEEQV
ncbi:hypothetical protein NOV72_03737 [Caballeronia novacaledonica]|uniref:Uncharacterized protein n=1 Tax=Caballeronia novacaledonica TaxID=1544861 RepID=A0A2U3I8U4_9BURK|nr:hypothetical protein [Caballeronia novacaledonica]SPB16538.1 hypothetical protein NOV72_03737 [Caballeronia novacaledonica]